MRGYVSFVLVFLASAIALSSYSLLSSGFPDISKAICAERAYGLQMNIKETALESVREGALEGFADYDVSHDVRSCVHCPGACLPPPSPNHCDPALCMGCFREDEARLSAALGAQARLASLHQHGFDGSFSIILGQPHLDVFLKPDPLSRNGFSVDYAILRSPLKISVRSDSMEISAASELPEGMVIR